MAKFCRVAVPPLLHLLTYRLPDELQPHALVGCRVQVPLGSRKALGYLLELTDEPEPPTPGAKVYTLKDVIKIDPELAVFSPEQISFFEWIAQFYQEPVANVLDTALPEPAEPKAFRSIKLISEELESLKGPTQREIVKELVNCGKEALYSDLMKKFPGCSSSLKTLEKRGIIIVESHREKRESRLTSIPDSWAKSDVSLRAEQSNALNEIQQSIDEQAYSPYLLHGITGSGKTEVYIEAIQHALKLELGSLIIVPEIALTPQLVERFRVRLGSNLSILHSGLHKHERWAAWQALLDGKNKIAVGARSAIFAPVQNLGLIIVDEEHDSSYKQADSFRYNARDLAMARAKLLNATVVLGSATPSLETYWKARSKRIKYLVLGSRHENATRPEIEIVDLNRFTPSNMPSRNISPPLLQALTEAFNRGEQAFLLYNRRGFATYLQCSKCEKVLECPNCSVTLTYHQKKQRLLCHYCGLSLIAPKVCDACIDATELENRAELVHRGAGTERVFDELREHFPEVAMERLDRDVVSRTQQLEDILSRVRTGETQALVGTQMIAKGHDLPGVTLVGIVDCDVGLHLPDFRAGERAFQLLTQTSGRAGRGDLPGRVLLQTRVPRHPSLVFTQSHDFDGFALKELQERKALGYPPYCRLLRIIVSGTDSTLCEQALIKMKSSIQNFMAQNNCQLNILGPTQAPIERLKSRWRWHMIVKGQKIGQLHQLLSRLKREVNSSSNIRITFDLDALDML